MVRGRLWRLVLLAGGVALVATGCGNKSTPQTSLHPQGPQAQTIANLINPVFAIAGVVFVLVLGGALYIAIKFRARGEDDFHDFPDQIHGNFKLEIGWTILPAILLAVVGAATVSTIFTLAKKPEQSALHVRITGQQWWWSYKYDLNNDGKYQITTANDFVIPAGRQIALSITSNDVIHSWWAPALNGKKDAVPNHVSPLTIQADHPGTFIGQCTEFCGLSHANMRVKVIALKPDDFAKWSLNQQRLAANPTDELAIDGWKTFAGECTACHRVNGMNDPSKVTTPATAAAANTKFKYPLIVDQVAGVVPNLTHLMSRTTFAGANFDLRRPTPYCVGLGVNWATRPSDQVRCLNRPALEAWLRDPPRQKPMAPGLTPTKLSRGMPNLHLSELQIDQLVAYLSTLK